MEHESSSKSTSTTSTASPPFDKVSADVILRTSDNIDFHVHKLVLSLASPFFETMFSLPQPVAPQDISLRERPVIDVSEDSKVIDCLLRYTYPVHDPEIDDLDLLDCVFSAAAKYELVDALAMITKTLREFIPTRPLQSYIIGCHQNSEEVASEAAAAWKLEVSGDDNAASFENTLAALSYLPELAAHRLSAGCYYRLLQYLRGEPVPTFCQPSVQPEDPEMSQLAEDLTELDLNMAVTSYPFDRVDADLILRSSDGVDFRVHRLVLDVNLSSDAEGSLDTFVKGFPETSTDGVPVHRMSYDKYSLRFLLTMCYPRDNIENWSIELISSQAAMEAIRAAKRYCFEAILRRVKARLHQLIIRQPFKIYCISVILGLEEEVEAAAKRLAFSTIHSEYCVELEQISASDYYRLLEYHHRCRAVIRSALPNRNVPTLMAGTAAVEAKVEQALQYVSTQTSL